MNDSICIKNIFVGGSTNLTDERESIHSAVHSINDENFKKVPPHKSYMMYNSYNTFIQRDQKTYNEFIEKNTDYCIFIFKDKTGNKSIEELNIAIEKYRNDKQKQFTIAVYVYKDKEVVIGKKISRLLKKIEGYYIPYTDNNDLTSHITTTIRDYSQASSSKIQAENIAELHNNNALFFIANNQTN